MGRRRKNNQINRHHILARSTFPPGTPQERMDENNVVELDRDFHYFLHGVFGNMPPELYMRFLRIVLTPGTRWTRGALERLRRELMDSK